MPSVFEYESYKHFVKDMISANEGRRGFQARLAEAAGCQASYLSQVLSGKAELTPDHAAGMSDFLVLHGLEQEYFITLILRARATSSRLRELFKNKLTKLRDSHQKIEGRLSERDRLPPQEILSHYYSAWSWSAIHVLTSIPRFSDAKIISGHLGLPVDKVQSQLEKMADWGLVSVKAGRWSFAHSGFHLPKDSVMSETNHLNWRARSNLDIQTSSEKSLHYTSAFAIQKSDYDKVRETLLRAIAAGREIIATSEPEAAYCLLVDFFEWG